LLARTEAPAWLGTLQRRRIAYKKDAAARALLRVCFPSTLRLLDHAGSRAEHRARMTPRRDAPPPLRASLLERTHAALGAFPLAIYLLLHALETWPALSGRAAFNARLHTTTSPIWLGAKVVLVLLPLVVHAALGIVRVVRGRGRDREPPSASSTGAPLGAYLSRGLRTLQAITGVLTAACLCVHLAELTVPLWRGGAPEALYETLSLRAGTPLSITLTAIGLAAVCFHAGQGVPAALVTLGLVRSAGQLSLARMISGLMAAIVWLMLLDVTSHFAVGRALFGDQTPAQPMGDIDPSDTEGAD